MKDTALAAMKRSAKAVLREELRALRKAARDEALKAAPLRARIADLEASLRRRDQEIVLLHVQVSGYRVRASKAVDWIKTNQSGNLGAQCCLEFVQGPPSLAQLGIGSRTAFVNPFDRWQVSPALR